MGGVVRDELLGRPLPPDVDIVTEEDALALAHWLHAQGTADHLPVTYPRFGTAMVHIEGVPFEIVTARRESYSADSRKPVQVQPATLREDAFRRDFTVNALMRNLHTGELLDLTGMGLNDLRAGLLRTPVDPTVTFTEDPLRAMRAVRFAAQLDFDIEPKTYEAICRTAHRLRVISMERIRDEFTKILQASHAVKGLRLLRETGLLEHFAPELAAMHGVEQNQYHLYDVWEHTLKVLEALPSNASLVLRLAALLHDVGKPATRTVDERGVHFYGHQNIGAQMAEELLRRLRYSNDVIQAVVKLVRLHMRPGEYDYTWSDAAVRRLIRDAGDLLSELLTLVRADIAASNPAYPKADIDALEQRIRTLTARENVQQLDSPLSGHEIMQLLNIPPGKQVGECKAFLLNEVIEGRLAPDDKEGAKRLLQERFR
ncbi:MAG: HD domain-containing protein [Armatimonadota bacterium]|nr:CCA tRNA nucleotidyltransferase [Armatimonadota bacterium]MDW8103895.1 HD domain-containing protein [Armatimonadota bacterium]MDW8289449.1 HD domain-containing protein [Armatimonadota bacterium]